MIYFLYDKNYCRLSDAIQGIAGVIYGVIIAFTYSITMAPIGLLTSTGLIILQNIISQIVKKRLQQDSLLLIEPSRVSFLRKFLTENRKSENFSVILIMNEWTT